MSKVRPINRKKITFGIIGTTELIMHSWSVKALRQLRMTAQERRKVPKVAREPEAEAEECTYKMQDGAPGFNVLAFKAALISAAHKDLGIEKTLVKRSFFIRRTPGMLVPLHFEKKELREDIVRVGANQTDIRYRYEFQGWKVSIEAIIDHDALTENDIRNLVNRAGFGCGVGEWRPERGGEYGRFQVDPDVDFVIEDIED